jgi:hypothetical protein
MSQNVEIANNALEPLSKHNNILMRHQLGIKPELTH